MEPDGSVAANRRESSRRRRAGRSRSPGGQVGATISGIRRSSECPVPSAGGRSGQLVLPVSKALQGVFQDSIGDVESRLPHQPVDRPHVVDESPRPGLFQDGESAGDSESSAQGLARSLSLIDQDSIGL